MSPTVLCPLHTIPMTYLGKVPAWSDKSLLVHAWHCPKCTAEVQRPIPEELSSVPNPPTTNPTKP